MKTIKAKYTISFCFSIICTKNVSIIINCIKYEKLCLLFNTKKFFEKNKIMLQKFLNIIFYTYNIFFVIFKDSLYNYFQISIELQLNYTIFLIIIPIFSN